MTSPVFTRGATLHILNTGPSHEPQRGHLHVILTNKCGDGHFLLVPVCSQHEKCDRTCLLGVGDHPFIVKPTFVYYSHADIYPEANLVKRLTEGDITFREQFDPKVFALICNGLTESRMTPPKFKKYYLANTSC